MAERKLPDKGKHARVPNPHPATRLIELQAKQRQMRGVRHDTGRGRGK